VEGWAAGPDGQRIPITAGWGVRWDAGEDHTSGTEAGMTVVTVEGQALDRAIVKTCGQTLIATVAVMADR
jgi:hypothetical protein